MTTESTPADDAQADNDPQGSEIDAPLLSYAYTTSPKPLQTNAPATLTIVVSASMARGDISVTSIVLSLPLGDGGAPDPTNLSDGTVYTVSLSDPNWQHTQGFDPGVIKLSPLTGTATLGERALLIEIGGLTVSSAVGTAQIGVVEHAQDAENPAATRKGTLSVGKFPPEFSFANFATSATLITAGEPVTLTWDGTPANYTLSYGGESVDVSKKRSWTSPPLFQSTVFQLTASTTQDNQTITSSLSTAVIVAFPTLQSLSVSPNPVTEVPITLSWRANFADGVYLWSGAARTVLPPSGTKTFIPPGNTEYYLQPFIKSPLGEPLTPPPSPLRLIWTITNADFSLMSATYEGGHTAGDTGIITLKFKINLAISGTMNFPPPGKSPYSSGLLLAALNGRAVSDLSGTVSVEESQGTLAEGALTFSIPINLLKDLTSTPYTSGGLSWVYYLTGRLSILGSFPVDAPGTWPVTMPPIP